MWPVRHLVECIPIGASSNIHVFPDVPLGTQLSIDIESINDTARVEEISSGLYPRSNLCRAGAGST